MLNISVCQKVELPRNKKLERIVQEAVVAQFGILSLDMPGRIEVNHTTLSVYCKTRCTFRRYNNSINITYTNNTLHVSALTSRHQA